MERITQTAFLFLQQLLILASTDDGPCGYDPL
jgi:hypothetical protein